MVYINSALHYTLLDIAYLSTYLVYSPNETNVTLDECLHQYFPDDDNVEHRTDIDEKSEQDFNKVIEHAKSFLMSFENEQFVNFGQTFTSLFQSIDKQTAEYTEDAQYMLDELINLIPYNQNTDLALKYAMKCRLIKNLNLIARIMTNLMDTVFYDVYITADVKSLNNYIEENRGILLMCDGKVSINELSFSIEILSKLNKFLIRLDVTDCYHSDIDEIGEAIYKSNKLIQGRSDFPRYVYNNDREYFKKFFESHGDETVVELV